MSKLLDNPEESKRLHPWFVELKNFYGIEDEMPSVGAAGPQKMASGLLCMNLRFLLFSFSFFSSTSFYILKVFNCVYNMQLSL